MTSIQYRTPNLKKSETFETWKEKKLIEEYNNRCQAQYDQLIKDKLNEQIKNGRQKLNELAVQSWLKKKQLERKEKEKQASPIGGAEPVIKHVSRNNIESYSSPTVTNKLKLNNEDKSAISYSQRVLDEYRNNYSNEDNNTTNIYKYSEETGNNGGDQALNNRNWITIEEYYKILDDFYHNTYKNENDETLQNSAGVKNEIDKTKYKNLSARQISNRISFNEWLREKNREMRERREYEKTILWIKRQQEIERKRMSKMALAHWYVRNAAINCARGLARLRENDEVWSVISDSS